MAYPVSDLEILFIKEVPYKTTWSWAPAKAGVLFLGKRRIQITRSIDHPLTCHVDSVKYKAPPVVRESLTRILRLNVSIQSRYTFKSALPDDLR
jgi:hypothetical protein